MIFMQNMSLRHTTPVPFPLDTALPLSPESKTDLGDLDQVLRALAESEQVIREQAEHIRHLENLAMVDELTGLLNRRGFLMSLQRELAIARRDSAANGIVIMVDLDGFKSVNDTWGHGTGDDYLKFAAQTLLRLVRSSDVVTRLGGDEFAILFPRMSETIGWGRLETLETVFNNSLMSHSGGNIPMRASFGMSSFKGTDNAEAVLAKADLKLYAHKARRRTTTSLMA
jgi:diguanylate cyclase (GGDEF)-like protein